MAKRRLPNSPDNTVVIVKMPTAMKNEVFDRAARRGEVASVFIREALRRAIDNDVA